MLKNLIAVAIGIVDLIFAVDSVPAILAITTDSFVVFAANAFALLGLRQLFFLLDGLLDRLVYLSYGLAAILGFIGEKLLLHALHENSLPFINGGQPLPVYEISTGLSLAVIIGVLTITVVASLVSPAGRAKTVETTVRKHARAAVDEELPEEDRAVAYRSLLAAEQRIATLPPKGRASIEEDTELTELVAAAHRQHAPV